MSILNNLIGKFKFKNQSTIQKSDLMAFTIALIREADKIERNSTGTPGRASIEYLLNMKYAVVENRNLNTEDQDILLNQIDQVLNKFASKYKVIRKGKEFIFNESEIVIVHPDCPIDKEQSIICKIHSEQAELESLKIQLAHYNLENSNTFRLKNCILQKERNIKKLKRDLMLLKYFSTYNSNSIDSLRNTQNIGENEMEEKRLSQKIEEKFNNLLEEGGRNRQLIKSTALIGAGLGGAAGLLAKKGPGMLGGGAKGAVVGTIVALLLSGGSGLAQLIKRGKDNPSKVKASVKKAVARAENSKTLTSTEKLKIKNNGNAVISKLDNMQKKSKNESLENKPLSTRILEKLDNIQELKKSTLAGAGAGAVAGNVIARKKATKGFEGKMLKAAKKDVKRTSDIAKGAAQRAKNLSKGGLVHKIKNAGQISRANKAAKFAKGNAKAAANTLSKATKAIGKAGMRGGVKGALIGGALAAGAAGLHKALKNRSVKKDKLSSKILEKLENLSK